jgi:hypothetical protein
MGDDEQRRSRAHADRRQAPESRLQRATGTMNGASHRRTGKRHLQLVVDRYSRREPEPRSSGDIIGAATKGRLFGYGVWRAPVLMDGGLPAIWAVDSFGVLRKVWTLQPGEDEEELGDRLLAWLLEHHPERKLELAREPAAVDSELARPRTSRGMSVAMVPGGDARSSPGEYHGLNSNAPNDRTHAAEPGQVPTEAIRQTQSMNPDFCALIGYATLNEKGEYQDAVVRIELPRRLATRELGRQLLRIVEQHGFTDLRRPSLVR